MDGVGRPQCHVTVVGSVSPSGVQGGEVPPIRLPWAGQCLPFRIRLGRAGLPPQMGSVLVLCPPAQAANLGRDSHVQLCSVRIPRTKENALQAIPPPAWAHTSVLGATFLDSSGPQTGAQPHLASILPQGGARSPPQLCAPACPPQHRETPTVLLAERKPTPGRALRRRCSTHSISSPHNTPSPAPVTVT